MDYRIVKFPSQGTIDLLLRRKGSPSSKSIENYDAVGLVQGRLIDMVFAAVIAGIIDEDCTF